MYTISSEKKVFTVKIYGSGLNKIRITLNQFRFKIYNQFNLDLKTTKPIKNQD